MEMDRRNRYLRALDLGGWALKAPAPASLAAAPVVIEPVSSLVSNSAVTRTPQLKADERPATPAAPSQPLVSVPPVSRAIPGDWPGLQVAVASCTACKLCRTRNNTVFGVGSEQAELMVIGEGPGADEDTQGFPFVGRAGKLLDEMLKAIGRSRTDAEPGKAVYIANVVKCRPPGNRDPENDEVEACRPYLDAQIEHIKPKLIVALGRIAAQRLLSSTEPLSKLRGPQHAYGERGTPVLITYHPAYLLRSPGEKAKSWADLKRVSRFLAGT